uniref:C-type lectin domain-containing protein n=1 Tax=Seriola dumerili TaxID=41447 RepID=A0A3B4TMX2_SERDU
MLDLFHVSIFSIFSLLLLLSLLLFSIKLIKCFVFTFTTITMNVPSVRILIKFINFKCHRTYTFITNKVTWMDAQIYCRTHYTGLATIENARENEEVRSKISGQAWIGLYREPWRWSDKRSSYFRNWKHGHPNNNGGGKHCAAESPGHGWVDRDCNSKFSFWCRKGEKKT